MSVINYACVCVGSYYKMCVLALVIALALVFVLVHILSRFEYIFGVGTLYL